MTSLNKIIIMAAVSVPFFVSCDDEYGPRKESTPVIESAFVSPESFTFGDSVTLVAKISDPATTLTSLTYEVATGGRIIASGSISIDGSSADVSCPVFIPLTDNQPDNAPVTVTVTACNVLKGVATGEITGLTGKRAYYSQLYLVTDDGEAVALTPQATNKEKYEATGLALPRAFNYRIAEKITADRQVDYSRAVWGNVHGRLAMIDARGEPAFAYIPDADYTQHIVFDNYAFDIALAGSKYGSSDIMPDAFAETSIDGEAFETLTRSLEKNREYTLFGKLADGQIVYNLDFFERIAPNKIRFLGETGVYTLYHNTYRQHVVIGVENPAYPDYLLITGGGIGYPTKVSGIDREHAWWGFGNVRNFILCRKISDDVFQGTIFIHAKDDSWVGFKPYQTTGWEGEKGFSQFTVTGEDVLEGTDDGNWHPKENVDTDAFYRLTVNWATNTVNVTKITL